MEISGHERVFEDTEEISESYTLKCRFNNLRLLVSSCTYGRFNFVKAVNYISTVLCTDPKSFDICAEHDIIYFHCDLLHSLADNNITDLIELGIHYDDEIDALYYNC